MSYPYIPMTSILNYIYANKQDVPFEVVRNTAINLFNFAKGNKIIDLYTDYTELLLMVLNALTGDGDVTAECQEDTNFYFNGTRADEYPNAPSDYVNTIRKATKAYEAEYNSLTERTAETRHILTKSRPLFLDDIQNGAIFDYINYATKYKAENSIGFFYSAIYNIGFIQGVRSERARRNGTPTAPNERTTVAFYQGRKHRRSGERVHSVEQVSKFAPAEIL